MDMVVILKNSTLLVLDEHSSTLVGGAVAMNEAESAVLLKDTTVRKLLDLAEPRDRTLDELLVRIAR